jgi:hypothetical protein
MPPSFDPVKEARELDALQLEHATVKGRMIELQDKIREKFELLKSVMPQEVTGRGYRSKPDKPRPVEDKIVISAGRAIVQAIRENKTPEQVREAAIDAGLTLAKKYNLTEIPPAAMKGIDKKVKLRLGA